MAESNSNTGLKRLRSHYRLVIMNDDTFEEVVKFRLTRFSAYIVASTVFVLMIGLTVFLLVLTPLKYYLPGSGGSSEARRELQLLKMRTDSLEQALKYRDNYFNGIKKALGAEEITRDTTLLNIPKNSITND
ncbi:MAG: hypothetical protein JST21_17915 [Bacteroidetes bacterium]|nr:hypothetical protein [Bacteroidota bacterium]